jgi:two-component system sensor histidine kinase VanS
LKNKTLFKLLMAIGSAIAAVLLFASAVRGKFGNWIVAFLRDTFHFYPEDANMVYQMIVRSNIDFIIFFAIVFLAAIISLVFIWRLRVQRVKAEKEAEQRKNELVAYLAHDIRTPLTSVIGYLNLLNEAQDLPEALRAKYLNITLDKAYRLEQLVDEFFEIARYNLHDIELSRQDIDLSYMLVQMADEFYPLLSSKGKRAAVHVPEDLTINGDPDKLARVFNNILKNAAAYSENNSVIDITAARSQDTVSVVFKNAGSIPQGKLDLIFNKFYRLDSARSSDTGGAGLGLAVAKEIVLRHGGRITASSSEGYTEFTVELPMIPSKR